MDIQETWEKALKQTEIVRPRVQPLATFAATALPYIFLAESSINLGDTVVRKGEVMVEKPSLILPPAHPQFEGFQSDENSGSSLDLNALADFLLIRGVQFPSLKYHHKVSSLDLAQQRLQEAIHDYSRELEKAENVTTGLVIGPEDLWQFSVLIFIANQVVRQAEGDIRKLWDRFRDDRRN